MGMGILFGFALPSGHVNMKMCWENMWDKKIMHIIMYGHRKRLPRHMTSQGRWLVLESTCMNFLMK